MDFFQSRANLAIAAFFFLGLFVLAIGFGLFFFSGKSTNDEVQILPAATAMPSAEKIVVDISGAVIAPGVYDLPANSRVRDAVLVAGGLTDEADRSRINMAAKIGDGQKIYVLAIGEQLGSSVVGSLQAGQSVGALININTASEAELDKLPGVGPVTAQKIIASRSYSAPEDLKTKKVVSASVFEKIKDLITVY